MTGLIEGGAVGVVGLALLAGFVGFADFLVVAMMLNVGVGECSSESPARY